jgi:hypothetical protein
VSVNIHVNSTPKHLRITPTMVDDFLIDPVLGVYVVFGVKLDVFQAVALRLMWWCPDFLDSSGFGTGKSLRFYLFWNLRAVIVGDQHLLVYYQTFSVMQRIFWQYYQQFNSRTAPLFAAQLGKLDVEGEKDGKDNTRGPACYIQHFKNESMMIAPAPNWIQDAKGQAGLTVNGAGVDEFTKVEAMARKDSTTSGINQQITGRVRRQQGCFNQNHPLWSNRRVFLATAETMSHPSYARKKNFDDQIAAGNPNYAVFTSCFKDFSNLRTERDIRVERGARGQPDRVMVTVGRAFRDQVPDWKTITDLARGGSRLTRAHFRREVLGLWARETAGLYSEAAMQRCVAAGMAQNLQPECTRNSSFPEVYYFNGIDPAPAQSARADDAGTVVLRARPKPGLGHPPTSSPADWLAEFVWAYRVRGEKKRRLDEGVVIAERPREFSGLIHRKHLAFNFTGLLMDPQGGGAAIWPEMNKSRQLIDLVEREVVPISTPDDVFAGNAARILLLFRREYLDQLWPTLPPGVDALYDAAHRAFEEAIEHGEVAFPLPFNERPKAETEGWSVEQQWALKNLDAVREQLQHIEVAMKEDGATLDLTRNGNRKFGSLKKKDLAYAAMFAYVRFLVWLKTGEMEYAREGEGEVGFYSY